jgi:ABC-type sugar transport system permease subunit
MQLSSPYAPPPPPPLIAPARSAVTGPVRIVIGLLIVLPAAIVLLIGYAWPTGRTLWWSLHEYNGLEGTGDWVLLDNFDRILSTPGRLLQPYAFALLLATLPLLTLLVVAPLLAVAAHLAGRGFRLTVRLALAVPMVCFAPAALALAWSIDRFDIEHPRASVWAAVGLTTFGLICAIGVTVYLAVLRGRDPGRPAWSVWPAALTVAALAVIVTLAVGLQSFTYPWIITRGGPERQTVTPMLNEYEYSFFRFEFGFGAAQGMLILILLMVLGVGAAALAILTGLRMEVEERGAADARSGWVTQRVVAAIATGVGLIVVLAVSLYGLWPWLRGLGRLGLDLEDGPSVATMLVNTWLPPLVSTMVGVGLAAVAGYGIGALRPLGRWSELLLLPFAPWLFVGVGPLVLADWHLARDVGMLDSFPALIPPVWLVVPALFLFALLFRGLEHRRRARAATGADPGQASVLLPALPMLALVGGATYLVQSQSLLWSLTGAPRADPPAPVYVWRLSEQFATQVDQVPLGLVLPIPAILIFVVVLALLQVFYLDRLSIRVGRTG